MNSRHDVDRGVSRDIDRDATRNLRQRIPEVLRKVGSTTPLVHHVTNLVVTNTTANVTLAIGASPVMANALEEVQDMVAAANALVLNVGTLTTEQVEAMILAGKSANARSIPVVLDPVGVGATPLRTRSVRRILSEVKVSILRGNEAEVSVIGGFGGTIRGVDSVSGHHDRPELARATAAELGCVVAVTGATDFVSDGDRLAAVENGHPLLRHVTGTGCMATAVIAAFAAVESDYVVAAAGALACYGYAAELAAAGSEGPGTFQAALFDRLFNIARHPEQLDSGVRVWLERTGCRR